MIGKNHIIRISVKVNMYMPTKMKIMEAEERLKNAHMTQWVHIATQAWWSKRVLSVKACEREGGEGSALFGTHSF